MTDAPIPLFEAWFGVSVPPHWDLHAWLMFAIWIVFIPAVVALTRFGKPPPSVSGIPKGSPMFSRKLLWFTVHRVGLFVLIAASLVGGLIAVAAAGGVGNTLHGVFGIGTLILGVLQIVSARWRGSHGGRDPVQGTSDPVFTRGDHYDMSPRRRWFEAYHKTVGYFAMVSAIGAVATGLSQYWITSIAITLGLVVVFWVVIAVVLEAIGFRHDTYLSNFGTGAHHPFNKARIDRLSGGGAD
ncbi:MAG: hypothetical protein EOS23_03575 [Mesorhizobium sp.]|uniref:cytochrome b561 domain-containing protein n=1 Tax=unclassified Mesorhizobium TaxID=325217 RepID=UPI000FCACC1F|nr:MULTISPECIES: cytochrome b561 domain-containing protein [unclassified Mesorhizobium]RUV63624.1 hypothetical protein EOA85_03355 [Mesorhizobium sp. M5C.F.Ca.IN.020.29.1.1]RWE14266.1 MAG: hypothetical protein EOS23_03575 [Mesorhizobium sp.]RWE89215.1 MAG: hypothetical protein EOS49_00980 [Mesorhizobium sp.]TIM91080.1 MAG: hypothetical protein E5Y50_00600 [Mesorhizobium sp.]TIS66413.1 MAG: hypothetical protein E5W92_14955 [Mesorhizobium sp.]